jgi:hypothetical protein
MLQEYYLLGVISDRLITIEYMNNIMVIEQDGMMGARGNPI